MSNPEATNGKGNDPAAAFRDLRDNYLDAWAKAMVEAVNSEAYAKANGLILDTYLSVSSPVRQTIEKVMLQTLQQFSMPSRADVVALAERVTNIEMQLDDMSAKLDRIERVLVGPPGSAKKRAVVARRSKKKGAE
jgi:hypothetical protein